MVLILYLVLIIFIVLDMKINRKILTPMFLLFFPNLVLLIIIKIIEENFDIQEFLIQFLIIELSWLFISIILKKVFFNLKNKNQKIKISYTKLISYSFFITMCLSFSIIFLKYGSGNLKGKSAGIFSHLQNILSVFPFIISEIYKNKKLKIMSWLGASFLILIGGKYQIFLYFLPLFLYKIEYSQFKFKKIFFMSILGIIGIYVLFYLTYYFNFLQNNIEMTNKQMINFIFNHVKLYILSPFYIGKYLLENPESLSSKIALTPFFNIFKFIMGNNNYVNPILKFQTYLGVTSNVGGIIPELVSTLGYVGMYIYMIVLGIISYFLDNLTDKNKLWIYSNLILKSSLVLCFFNNVFSVFGYIERIIGSILFIIFLKIIKGVENERNDTSRREWNKTLSNNESDIKTDKSNI